MTVFTREEARNLATRRDGHHVSLLMPVHPVAADFQQDVIRLRNLLRAAKEQLVAQGVRAPVADELLAPAAAPIDSLMFWKQGGRGLAMYLTNGFFRAYRVPLELSELVTVSDEFHLKPLLRLLHGDGTYFVLALSGNEVRLLQCTHHEVQRRAIPDVPVNKADASKYRVNTPTLQGHTGAGRTTGPIGNRGRGGTLVQHGQGVGIDDQKIELLEYFRMVDRGLRDVLRGEQAPLILAGVGYYHPLFAEATTYPFLHDEPLEGNWDDASDAEVQKAAWRLVEPVFDQQRLRQTRRYLNLVGGDRARSELKEVLSQACAARVDTLFVPVGRRRWGTYDEEADRIELHDRERPGDVDLLNEAAVQTLIRGGTVYAVEPEEMPEGVGSDVAAILRW